MRQRTGQTTSYRPCTTIVGMCRLSTQKQNTPISNLFPIHPIGTTHILSISCFSNNCPSLIHPYESQISKRRQRFQETEATYVIHKVMILDPCKCADIISNQSSSVHSTSHITRQKPRKLTLPNHPSQLLQYEQDRRKASRLPFYIHTHRSIGPRLANQTILALTPIWTKP